jgi:hypothetical protein
VLEEGIERRGWNVQRSVRELRLRVLVWLLLYMLLIDQNKCEVWGSAGTAPRIQRRRGGSGRGSGASSGCALAVDPRLRTSRGARRSAPRAAPRWSRAVPSGATPGTPVRRARLLPHTAGSRVPPRAPCVRALARTLRAGALARVVGASLDTRRLKPAFGGVGWRLGWGTSSHGGFGERGAVGRRNAPGFGRSGQSRGMTVARAGRTRREPR